MSKLLSLGLLLVIAINNNAQSYTYRELYPSFTAENANDTTVISAYLSAFLSNNANNYKLSLNTKKESPFSIHYQFNQNLNGILIKDASIKINLSKNGKVLSVFSNWLDTVPASVDAANDETKNNLITHADAYMAKKGEVFDTEKTFVYVFEENELKLYLQLNFREQNGLGKEILINQSGIVSEKTTSVFLSIDSTVSGKVFNPDPLTTAQVAYGGTYIDNNNADSSPINNERQTKEFKADFDGAVFRLKNSFIQLQDINSDGTIPVVSSSPVFDFTRSQSGFEDVNAYYHLSRQREYIHSLGFTSADALAKIDPHGTADDNSYFTAPNNILFGTGGVDDAEDADVLLHEYSHFVSYNSAPNSNSGFERNSIDEAIADYFAASYSKRVSDYNSGWVYNWDGHNEFWNGRIVNSSKHYPEDLSTTSYYKNAELLSSTLMNIYDELGYAYTDSLVLSALYFFAPNMTQAQVAKSLLQCDTLLTGGKNSCTIYKHCHNRGYLAFEQNSCGISAINEVRTISAELLNTPNGFVIRGNDDVHILSYQIFNLSGSVCYTSSENLFDKKDSLASGLYLVRITTNQGGKTLKWINF